MFSASVTQDMHLHLPSCVTLINDLCWQQNIGTFELCPNTHERLIGFIIPALRAHVYSMDLHFKIVSKAMLHFENFLCCHAFR